jgi:hypothetical protein
LPACSPSHFPRLGHRNADDYTTSLACSLARRASLTTKDGTSRSVLQFSSSWGHVLRIRLRRLNMGRSTARNAPRKSMIR